MNVDLIRASTPIVLAIMGGMIAAVVLIVPGLSDAKWSAGLGLAGTALGAAAGLAQSAKSESSVSVSRDKIEAEGNSID